MACYRGWLRGSNSAWPQRADGFGYRAKLIAGSVAALLEEPAGGSTWLQSLRTVPYAEALEALSTLMDIGPKARFTSGADLFEDLQTGS
ncbi:hypothetical protein WJX72_012177 [[Myrmecia] bisecta]|uniref:Uncharacterized protein n=1 Tax=[Myrmecia] bisecta TaxID=41462 RepID=A0AAW1PTG0_9CHLO